MTVDHIAHELRIANLIAYHSLLDAKSPEARAIRSAIRAVLAEDTP